MLSSNSKIPSSNSEHQQVWNLLPWYINNSLDPAEQYNVINHIRTCVTCRIELNQQQQVFEKMQQTDLLQQISKVSFAQLQKRIAEQPKRHDFAKHHESKKEPKLSRQFLGFVQYTALAASLLLMAMPIMLGSLIDRTELKSDYRTLANPMESEPKNNVLRIIFADQSNPEEIEAILDKVSGHIVKGPSENGVYLVQIGNHRTNSQEIKDAISHLHKNSQVIFAELAHGLPSSD